MSTMTFTKIEVRGKKEYAYEITSYWDKETKSSKQKKRYLGIVIDKKKKIYEKKKIYKPEKLILDFGDTYVLQDFFKNNNFIKIIKDVFLSRSDYVLTLMFYRLCYPSAMKYIQTWYDGNYVKLIYPNLNLSSQRISDYFLEFGREDLQRDFFKQYFNLFSTAKKGIIIDATSLPNQIHMPLTVWGRKGEEIDKQIRFLLVVDKKNEMPLFFRYFSGNIVDVSTLKTTIAELAKFGVKETYIYFDAGYFSEENIKDLYKEKMNFLTRLPSGRVLFKKLVEEEIDDLEDPSNAINYGKKILFVKRKKVFLFEKEIYVYIVLDSKRKARELNNLMIKAIEQKEIEDKDIKYKFKTRGMMMLVSSFKIKREEVVPAYYVRQTAEKMFGFSKSDLELLPLRVHKEETLRGFLFLQFLTLIAFVQLKKKLGKKHTVEELLLNLRNLKSKVYEKEIIITELTKKQKALIEELGIIVPKNLGV